MQELIGGQHPVQGRPQFYFTLLVKLHLKYSFQFFFLTWIIGKLDSTQRAT